MNNKMVYISTCGIRACDLSRN